MEEELAVLLVSEKLGRRRTRGVSRIQARQGVCKALDAAGQSAGTRVRIRAFEGEHVELHGGVPTKYRETRRRSGPCKGSRSTARLRLSLYLRGSSGRYSDSIQHPNAHPTFTDGPRRSTASAGVVRRKSELRTLI
jgi:hypothetical protein